eukprot:UN28442
MISFKFGGRLKLLQSSTVAINEIDSTFSERKFSRTLVTLLPSLKMESDQKCKFYCNQLQHIPILHERIHVSSKHSVAPRLCDLLY